MHVLVVITLLYVYYERFGLHYITTAQSKYDKIIHKFCKVQNDILFIVRLTDGIILTIYLLYSL